MKKLLSVTVCIILMLGLVACGKHSGKKNYDIDIEYYVKSGQIAEVDYKLGDSAEDTKAKLNETKDDLGEPNFYEYSTDKYTVMTDGAVCCCYKSDEKNEGITHIVKYNNAFGFNTGAVSTQISDIMADLGYESEERNAKDGELFFLPGGNSLTVLEYTFGENTVLFAFQDHALSATIIYRK